MRVVQISEGEMAPIYVEPGYSTLLKFDSHPEPGLVGDQDSFKIEYMRNMVAIKPLILSGKTNLFIFTKEGQFGFQLIASRGRHDNNVYVQRPLLPQKLESLSPTEKLAVSIDELPTRKINKSTSRGETKLTLQSLSIPASKSTVVFRFSIQQKILRNAEVTKVAREQVMVVQGKKQIPIENIFLERNQPTSSLVQTNGLILIRTQGIERNEDLRLIYSPKNHKGKSSPELQVSTSAAFIRP